jgi:hypothetical protein
LRRLTRRPFLSLFAMLGLSGIAYSVTTINSDPESLPRPLTHPVHMREDLTDAWVCPRCGQVVVWRASPPAGRAIRVPHDTVHYTDGPCHARAMRVRTPAARVFVVRLPGRR